MRVGDRLLRASVIWPKLIEKSVVAVKYVNYILLLNVKGRRFFRKGNFIKRR